MSRIKSALEIALEKAEAIDIDQDKIRMDMGVRKGREISGRYITNSDVTPEKVQEEFEAEKDKDSVRKGFLKTILLNMNLPMDDDYEESFSKLISLANIAYPDSPQLLNVLKQLGTFFKQYIANRQDLIKRMTERFQPVIQEKEAKLRQQYGPDFHLDAEDDPEFRKLVSQNLTQLAAQYQKVLDNAKENIEKDLMGQI